MLSRNVCGEKSRANSTAETLLSEKPLLYQDGTFREYFIPLNGLVTEQELEELVS